MTPLKSFLNQYKEELSLLEEGSFLEEDFEKLVLDLFLTRDKIQAQLSDIENVNSIFILELEKLDLQLKSLVGLLHDEKNKLKRLHEIRDLLNPRIENWWWHIFPSKRSFWNVLAVILAIACIALLSDLFTRLINSPREVLDPFSAVGSVLLTLLTAVAATSLFTKAGQESVINLLSYLPGRLFKIQTPTNPKLRVLILSCFLLTLLVCNRLILFVAASQDKEGEKDLKNGDYAEAIYHFKRSIHINPEYNTAHYGLGTCYLYLQQIDLAQNEYEQALKLRPDFVEYPLTYYKLHTALARIYIFKKKYYEALNLLDQAIDTLNSSKDSKRLDKLKNDNFYDILHTKYGMYKDRGWVNLELKFYNEARRDLEKAISIAPQRAYAHCLMAILNERAKKEKANPKSEWIECLNNFKYEAMTSQEAYMWKNMAIEYIDKEAQKNK